jgi:F-type H+-transporting ATPase subunit b
LSLCTILGVLIFSTDVFAAEEITPGRRLWNNIMLVVNFGILVFLFIKYARRPLLDFLKGIRKKTENQLNELNGLFETVRSEKEEEEAKLTQVEKRIREIRESILEMGKREKEKAIDEGKKAAAKLIEDAKEYSKYRMDKAKKEFSDEMVEIAIQMVNDSLKENISKEDDEKLRNQFISNLDIVKGHLG